MKHVSCVSALAFALVLGSHVHAQETPPSSEPSATGVDEEQVEQLIRQLGASRLKEREEATRQLIAIGKPVLARLKKLARESREPEIRARARNIVDALERVSRIIANFRNDDVRWNAHEAMEELREIGLKAVPELEKALKSDDWQQRQLAASLLREMREYVPSDELLKVTVEGLRDDDLPWEKDAGGKETACTWISNAREGMEYFLKYADRAEKYLLDGLNSDDGQQQFLCAYILGMAGKTGSVKYTSKILIHHLADNNIDSDACLAVPALYRLGKEVIPHLNKALEHADEQQRELIQLIIGDLTEPKGVEKKIDSGEKVQHITGLVHDPAIDPPRIDILQWSHFDPVPLEE